jgi:predicted RecA/RadA family phage recombinase
MMATNVIHGSENGAYTERYVTTGNVTSGTLLLVGNGPAIALETATPGPTSAVMVGCAAKVTKKAAASSNVTVGGFVSYTTTGGVNAVRGTTATGDIVIGYGLEVAVTGATTAVIRLIQGPAVRIG